MGSGPIDPRELLTALDCFLGKDGEIKAVDGITKIFNLMKESRKMVSRCIYMNIVQQTRSPDILAKFIKVGGYKLLNAWLTYSKSTSNSPLLQQILITLHSLPLTVDHLKQNNTAKLVKQLSKSSEDEEVRRLAAILVDEWMGMIRSQSNPQPAEKDKKKKREDGRNRSPVHEKLYAAKPEVKVEVKDEDSPEKRKEKPKTQRTTAPSHAKFRSTGLELEPPAPILAPLKKNINAVVISDKYNIKIAPLKRQGSVSSPAEPPPAEKKYKPLNTTPNTTKEIKVKIIPAQPMESLGFLDALNSAPIPGVKIKKKKKALSPTSSKSSPFEIKTTPEASDTKPPSPDPLSADDSMELERPTTPVPAEEIPEPMETSAPEAIVPIEIKPAENPLGMPPLTRKGRKKKTVTWCEESKLREYFYFEMDETERVNVNKVKDFGEAARREMLKDREAFENARRLSHDAMEETVLWVYPKRIDMTPTLVHWGSSSQEKYTQAEREKLILQEIFLTKERVPDSPHEPDPESYEPVPPKLIPLDEESSMDVTGFQDVTDQGITSQSPDGGPGAKLPPVLANLIGSMGTTKGQPAPSTLSAINALNVQELLTTIMGAQGNPKQEELLKQPDFSDKIKQLLGNLQGVQSVPPAGLGPPVLMNGFPPVLKNMIHFPPGGPVPPFQGPPHLGPGGILGPGGMVGPVGGPGGPVGGPGGPVGGPGGGPVGGPGGGPVGGPVCGPGGPVGGPVCGPGGPVGGPVCGPVGPVGGPVCGPGGPVGGPGGPVGPRMMGPPLPIPPPPPQQHEGFWEQTNDNMQGGPHGGMRGGPPFHRGRGHGGEPHFRGRGRGGPPNAGRGGHDRGHDRGHRAHDRGHDRGHERGRGGHDRGHDRGYDGGHDRGYDGGHDRGYDGGHDRGYDGGHDRGYDGGYDEGHDRGYDRGHNRGHERGRGHGKGHGGMTRRPTCRHFMFKGNCRYEQNCAFYHPGVNGPP
ncbi:serine/threonine-protein phosphatase 1 regulatory subunit 10 [Ambystoma mexicanum]|uniref:serine/threonine-protein phosphatase 1 regulatory subunit 10 n=1 Tax=Ambystoma mexicanum TaxID=8296 RepID=UPI0037E86195